MKSLNRVLITDRFDAQALVSLKSDTTLEVAISAAPLPTAEELGNTQALIIRSRTKITRDLLALAPGLKLIVTATSGFDHIDLQATSEKGVQVMFTPDANAASAAELTWSLILACARRLPEAIKAVKAGEWRRESLVGCEMSGRTLGVIGIGRIGSRVARIGAALGMRIVAFDPYKDAERFAELQATRVSLDELFRLSDIVSIHVPSTPETDNLITANLLNSAGDGTILVNTSRGSAVREKDLLEALRKGRLSACGLDVFEREPLPRHSELLQEPRIVTTPHLGATTTEAFAKASQSAADKVRAFLATGAVTDPLPPDEAWWQAMSSAPFKSE